MNHGLLIFLQLDLENNGPSLPSSDASMVDNVAPEPAEDPEDVNPLEDVASDLEEPVFLVSFQNENGQTEVTVEGVDQDMLLFDLTLAFKETGVRSAYTFFFNPPRCAFYVRKYILVLKLFNKESFTQLVLQFWQFWQ